MDNDDGFLNHSYTLPHRDFSSWLVLGCQPIKFLSNKNRSIGMRKNTHESGVFSFQKYELKYRLLKSRQYLNERKN